MTLDNCSNKFFKTTRLVFLLSLFIFGTSIKAQQVQFYGECAQSVEVGRSFSITYTVNQSEGNVSLPNIGNSLKLVGGPDKRSGHQTTIINGRVENKTYTQFVFTLTAQKEGTVQIPPATYTLKGNSYKSNALSIKVTPSAINRNTVFIRVVTSKKDVYIGEQLTATIKLYSQYKIEKSLLTPPDYQGFYKQDIETREQRQLETINGTRYMTEVLQRVVLFPKKSGKLEISGGEARVYFMANSNSFWGFGDLVDYKIEGGKTSINVKPLPDNAPGGFKGAVGQFTLNASVNQKIVKTNEAFTFKVSLKGEGNIKLTPAPELNLPNDFELYEPKLVEKINNSANGQSGSKTFEYIAIARYAGNYRVSPVSLTYFDPGKGEFKTLKTQEFSLTVEKGNDSLAAPSVMMGMSKEEIKFIGSDIRYIKTKTDLVKEGNYFFGTTLYYLFYPLLLATMLVIIIVRRKQVRNNSNAWLVKNKKANKQAVKRLKKAHLHYKNGENEQFYEELAKAIWGYISDKLSIPVSQLSKEKAVEMLTGNKVDLSLTESLIQIIDDCEFARYAPSGGQLAMQEHYDNATKTIGRIEQTIR